MYRLILVAAMLLLTANLAWAKDYTATLEDGSQVLLKEDGTYEWIKGGPEQGRLKVRIMETPAQKGEIFKIGKWEYRILDIWWHREAASDNPDGGFLMFRLRVSHKEKSASPIPKLKLIDEDEIEYEQEGKIFYLEDQTNFWNDLNPKVKKTGIIVFNVPKDQTYKLVLYSDVNKTKSLFVPIKPLSRAR